MRTYSIQLIGAAGTTIKYRLAEEHINTVQEGEIFIGQAEGANIGIFVRYGQELKAVSFDDESFKVMYDELDEIETLLEGLKNWDGNPGWGGWNNE